MRRTEHRQGLSMLKLRDVLTFYSVLVLMNRV